VRPAKPDVRIGSNRPRRSNPRCLSSEAQVKNAGRGVATARQMFVSNLNNWHCNAAFTIFRDTSLEYNTVAMYL
jgi:hypothetical protein